MVTIPKLFSVLVASGNGERCDELKRVVRAKLRANDRVTGKSNQFLFNEGKDLFKKDHRRVCKELSMDVHFLYKDISAHFFNKDLVKKN